MPAVVLKSGKITFDIVAPAPTGWHVHLYQYDAGGAPSIHVADFDTGTTPLIEPLGVGVFQLFWLAVGNSGDSFSVSLTDNTGAVGTLPKPQPDKIPAALYVQNGGAFQLT